MPRKLPKVVRDRLRKNKPTSPVELARREWCKRNFLLAGLAKNIELIATELNLTPANYLGDITTLIGVNNRDGRAKGLNIT